jgi:hypothetical protein
VGALKHTAQFGECATRGRRGRIVRASEKRA